MIALRSAPLATLSTIALVTLLASSCGSSDDAGGDSDASVGSSLDAGGTIADASLDAPPAATNGLGQTCDGSEGQADCPDNHQCLRLRDGSNPWCSITCLNQSDTVCREDYEGPGLPLCALTVRNDDDTTFRTCTVMCRDATGNICDEATCDGSCPGTLVCMPSSENPDQSYCS